MGNAVGKIQKDDGDKHYSFKEDITPFWFDSLLVILVIVCLCLKFLLIFKININHDEFHYLSQIYEYLSASLTNHRMTFHVHLFPWLKEISRYEFSQIISARIVMFFLFTITCVAIYNIGRKFFAKREVLIGLLIYLSFSFVVANGAAFRPDSISNCLIMIGMWILIYNDQKPINLIIAGFLFSLSYMITIKSVVLIVPIVLILFGFLVIKERRQYWLKRIFVFLFSLSGFYIVLNCLHKNSLNLINQNIIKNINISKKILTTAFINDGFFPGCEYFLISLKLDPYFWILFLSGFLITFFKIVKRKRLFERDILFYCATCLPIMSILFYRNSFPYYYVFVLPTSVLVCSLALTSLKYLCNKKRPVVYTVASSTIVLLLFTNFAIYFKHLSKDRIKPQRDLITAVHDIFPEPVYYIDGISMISTYKKVGFFMSSWGMESYLQGPPIMEKIVKKYHPPLLINNVPPLNLEIGRQKAISDTKGLSLVERDYNVLTDNFIQHWGNIYVAGKRLGFSEKKNNITFEILIPGIYTIEANRSIFVDEKKYKPNDVIFLNEGLHSAKSLSSNKTVVLRWGKNLKKPSTPFKNEPIFFGKLL